MSDSSFIPLCVPHIRARELDYVRECIETEWVSSAGPFVDKFEREFAREVGSRYAVACASGTAALHVSLLLAGVKRGDLVLVPTLTFISSVNAIHYCGAAPVFLDCDDFYNLEPDAVELFLRDECEREREGVFHRASGRRIGAIMPVHIFGNAVSLERILLAAREHDLPVVEDAAEGLGTRYHADAGAALAGRHVGTLGLFGCFSFNGNKIITTGGGGMIVMNDESLAKRAKYLTTQAKDDEARFIHNEVGFNYRLTNVQAAIGLGQLECLADFKKRKREIYERYEAGLAGIAGLRLAPVPVNAENNHWMPCLQIQSDVYGESRDEVMSRLGGVGIQVRPVWELNHRQRPYLGAIQASLSRAEALHAITLNLPCSVGLSQTDQEKVIRELRRGR